MRTPPFLLAAALLFWGWRNDLWIVGALAGLVLEAARFVPLRWEFTEKDYRRIWDICVLLAGGVALYFRFGDEAARIGFRFIQWLPILFSLAMFAQVYGSQEVLPWSVFSWLLRRAKARKIAGGLNLSWPFFSLCLLASGANNQRDNGFYIGCTLLVGWALWSARPKRFHAVVWLVCFALAAKMGFQTHQWMNEGQTFVEARLGELLAKYFRRNFDPAEARTSMGRIEALKGSGRIVLRVHEGQGRVPDLLRQASYNTFHDISWTASRRDFRSVTANNDATTWNLVEEPHAVGTVAISMFLPRGRGLLPLPSNAGRLRDLPVGTLDVSSLGVVRVDQGQELVRFTVEHSSTNVIDSPPDEFDLKVPPEEQSGLEKIAQELELGSLSKDNRIRTISRFFLTKFTYSLNVPGNSRAKGAGTPINRFLNQTRAGHCEYFASATALLLRQVGIPARYVVGWSVDESDRSGKTFLIRERHAHAWAQVWQNGTWVNIDNTPGSWGAAERKLGSPFEPVSDFFSMLWYQFSAWRWLGERGLFSQIAPWLVIPLSIALGWSVFSRRRRDGAGKGGLRVFNWPGMDSELFEVERRLEAAGCGRLPSETSAEWVRRLRESSPPGLPVLEQMIPLHYRLRFDPEGLDAGGRVRLRQLVTEWKALPAMVKPLGKK